MKSGEPGTRWHPAILTISIKRDACQQTRHIETMLGQCWDDVVDGEPTLNQHCTNVSCLLGASVNAVDAGPAVKHHRANVWIWLLSWQSSTRRWPSVDGNLGLLLNANRIISPHIQKSSVFPRSYIPLVLRGTPRKCSPFLDNYILATFRKNMMFFLEHRGKYNYTICSQTETTSRYQCS